MTSITGAKFVADWLSAQGVKEVFGYQGGAILKLVHEICSTGEIRFIQTYNEQGAGFAAEGSARMRQSVGVAMATSGPGATNLVTSIASAFLDSIPVVFITGQDYAKNIFVNTGARLNGFQDLDIVRITASITKYAATVSTAEELPRVLDEAMAAATSGRPGPVLIDIPIDVQFQELEDSHVQASPADTSIRDADSTHDVRAALEALLHARRPVVLLGGGVRLSHMSRQATDFCKILNIPVVCTLAGLDATDDHYGFSGLYGNTHANLAIQNADVLLVLGARLGQRQVGKDTHRYTSARVIHVDVDQSEIGRVVPTEFPLNIDLATFFGLAEPIADQPHTPRNSDWHKTIRGWKEAYSCLRYVNEDDRDPVKFVEQVMDLLQDDAVIVSDVGQNQMWVAQAYEPKPGRRLMNSVGLGAMGFSLPVAIGAKIAAPDRQVIAFMGDGGLQINIQELMILQVLNVPVKVIVFNNRTMAMIREVQERYFNSAFHGVSQDEFGVPHLETLAEAYGLDYLHFDADCTADTLSAALSSNAPVLIEYSLSEDSRVTNRYDEAAHVPGL